MKHPLCRLITRAVWFAFLAALACRLSAADKPEAKPESPPQLLLFQGEITQIEEVTRAVTVRRFPITKTFLVAVDCKITTMGKPNATLKDLKRGDVIKVRYEQAKDGLVARRIIIRGIDQEDREDAREQEQLEKH